MGFVTGSSSGLKDCAAPSDRKLWQDSVTSHLSHFYQRNISLTLGENFITSGTNVPLDLWMNWKWVWDMQDNFPQHEQSNAQSTGAESIDKLIFIILLIQKIYRIP